MIIRNRKQKYKIVKALKYLIIYSVLSANRGLWVALGTPFETLLEVKRAVRAVKKSLWNGFGSSFLEKFIF